MIYLPPETIGNKNPHGIESDIWSLGLVLTEMICRKFPLIESEEDNESLKAVTFKLAEIKNGLKIENLIKNSVFGKSVLENMEVSEIEFINICLQSYNSETKGPRPNNYRELKKLDFYKDFEENLFNLQPFLQ
uniref:Protein kinase domain-containing protein n=1 Tax=Panagrolaimus davidi TaxID=227884 RepID=A0A914QEQ6_9BILA